MFTRAWTIGAMDRAIKAAAADIAVLWGASSWLHVDFHHALVFIGATTGMSLPASVASAPVGDKGTTSALPGGQ